MNIEIGDSWMHGAFASVTSTDDSLYMFMGDIHKQKISAKCLRPWVLHNIRRCIYKYHN